MREVALESAEENLRSPRLASDSNANGYSHSHDNDPEHTLGGDGGYLNQAMDAYRQHEQGALAAAHDAGGGSSSDEDLDEDTELDDDMMDKISSSPSIEDGAFCYSRPATAPIPVAWPRRVSSLPYTPARRQVALYPARCATASPPRHHRPVERVSTSRPFPVQPTSQHRSLLPRPLYVGEYATQDQRITNPCENDRSGIEASANASIEHRRLDIGKDAEDGSSDDLSWLITARCRDVNALG